MYERAKELLHQVEQLPLINEALERHYARRFASATNANLFCGVYPDFATASEHAPAGKPIGYDNDAPASAEMYRFRMAAISPCDYPVAFWLNRLMQPGQRLLDFGGHVGVLYYALSRYLSFPDGFEWQLYDVPAVIREARQFAKASNAPPALTFCDDLKQAPACDWVLFSGSLQYLEDSLSSLVGQLRTRPTYVLINMLPVHRTKSFVTLQNIGTAFCPYKIYSADELAAEVATLRGEVVDHWRNADKACSIPFHAGHSLDYYCGQLIRLPATQ